MPVTIYADTLIFINVFVTYFLLLTTEALMHTQIRRLRLLVASLVGGIYALVLLIHLPVWVAAMLRIVICCVLLLIANKFVSLRRFLKSVCIFLSVNFVFAGLMLAVSLLIRPAGFLCSFGTVYFDVDIPFILVLTLLAYGIIRLALLLSTSHNSDTHFGSFTIHTPCGIREGKGIFDTGNHLCDNFTGKPVILVGEGFADTLVPDGVREFLHGKALSECTIDAAWQNKLRLFPYQTVGGSGLLPAFRCDSVTLTHMKTTRTYARLYVAVSNGALGAGEYDALFPCALFEEMSEGEENHDFHNSGHPSTASQTEAAILRPMRALHQRVANFAAASKEKRGSGNPRTTVRR